MWVEGLLEACPPISGESVLTQIDTAFCMRLIQTRSKTPVSELQIPEIPSITSAKK